MEKKYINWPYVLKNPVFGTKSKGTAAGADAAKLQGMYYQGDDKLFDQNELDVRLLKYSYAVMVLRNASNYKADKSKKTFGFYFPRYSACLSRYTCLA